jgi:hypothetical protein
MNLAKDKNAQREGRDQARKHAEDVFRAAAMMTRKEDDSTKKVLDAVRSSTGFLTAAQNFTTYCDKGDGFGLEAVRDRWMPEDLDLLHQTIATWLEVPQ